MIEESIVSAAVIVNGLVISLPRPYRHHDILYALCRSGMEDPGPQWQGFLTSKGRYVGRKEAVYVALRYGQIAIPKKTFPQDELFSEDLW